jgi:8-oxo-dGTP diphosphatase
LRRLSERGIGRIVSSPYRRCIETVEPLAGALGLTVELDDRLAEGAPSPLALALLAELDGGLACTHGDVIHAVLGYGLRKGAAAVTDVSGGGAAVLEALPAP